MISVSVKESCSFFNIRLFLFRVIAISEIVKRTCNSEKLQLEKLLKWLLHINM